MDYHNPSGDSIFASTADLQKVLLAGWEGEKSARIPNPQTPTPKI